MGVDLHKRMSQIAVLTADGELTQHRLPNDLAHLEPFFAQLPTPSPIAIEASGTWWWLVDLLERLGHPRLGECNIEPAPHEAPAPL
jgi:hypothetical protein